MSLYRAIRWRRSIRDYPNKELTEVQLDDLENDLAETRKFNTEVSVDARLVRDGRALQEDISGIIADYGKVEAPHYLVLTSEDTEDGYIEVGYRYEFVVLDLAAQGIGTCWIGKGFQDEQLNEYIELPSGQTCVTLIALGPLSDEEELYEIENPKRKAPGHFLIGRSPNSLAKETVEIIDCFRRAPSALNAQPWRVIGEEGTIHLYLRERNKITKIVLRNLNQLNRVDAGIGLCHLEVGGKYFQDGVEVGETNHPEKKGLSYIGSLIGRD
ncbi:MAG: nitroreductase family protein [Candidatus Bipolaricaulota bacterium]|nr:nitroreductase family protein [Candidatus Bipolaricaulota bacterium]MBS3791502.1 nitroreductase family protein [Candidatus Bipolaricaulota bacterium]